MARPIIDSKEDADIEVWETATPGTTWVYTWDRREDRYTLTRIGGRSASKRVNITRDDRKYNQERIPDENTNLDPFTNGTLRFVKSASRDELLDTRYHMDDAALVAYFEVRDTDLFMTAVREIESEVVLRKLQRLSPENGTVAQTEALTDYIRVRYPQGGTQRAVREMLEAGDRLDVGEL